MVMMPKGYTGHFVDETLIMLKQNLKNVVKNDEKEKD